MSEQLMLEILTAILLVVVFSGFIFTGMHYLAKYLRENSFPGWHAPPHLFAPEVVWYDEPPFAKDGESRPCWIAGEPFSCAVYWSGREWRVYVAGDSHIHGLRGRRVCPIVKPPEPTA